MYQREFTSTPELTMLDSFPSTPDSSHIDLADPSLSSSLSSESSPSIAIDPHLTNMLSIFVDNIFEKDPLSQPYLSLLTDAEKAQLKSQLVTSRSLIMSVQGETPPNHAELDAGAGAGVPWDECVDDEWQWDPSEFHLDTNTTTDVGAPQTLDMYSDPTLFPPLDPSSYFDFQRADYPDSTTTGPPKTVEDWAAVIDSMLQDAAESGVLLPVDDAMQYAS